MEQLHISYISTHGTLSQVGNAVPPPLAKVIGLSIRAVLT